MYERKNVAESTPSHLKENVKTIFMYPKAVRQDQILYRCENRLVKFCKKIISLILTRIDQFHI